MMRPVFRLKEGVSLVLASGSPRRREFVAGWGVPFTQRTADSEPRPEEEEGPLAYVVRSAEAKLAASRTGSCELVIPADTVVVHGGKIIGKPRSDSEALAMLQELCGSEHHVATGVALAFPDGTHKAFADSCAVRFAPWDEASLRAYVATGECRDKAGAYAIQGQGAFLVESISGCWSTVVGLPIERVTRIFVTGGWLLPAV